MLPLVLVNGAEGIGTGWSTNIPNYNPRDIVANLRALLAGAPVTPMHPWYNGFRGTIQEAPSKTAGRSYSVYGTIAQVRAQGYITLSRQRSLCRLACHFPGRADAALVPQVPGDHPGGALQDGRALLCGVQHHCAGARLGFQYSITTASLVSVGMPFPPGAPMHPWYNGFRGTIQEAPSKTAGRSYSVYGTIAQVRA